MGDQTNEKKESGTVLAVENGDGHDIDLTELSPAQVTVLRMVAEWEKPADIRAAVTEEVGADKIGDSWLRKVCSEACRPEWAKPIIDKFRQEFLAARDSIPCRHAAYRLRKLQEIIEGSDNDRTQLQALREAHEQSGDKVEKVADVTSEARVKEILGQLDAAEDAIRRKERNNDQE